MVTLEDIAKQPEFLQAQQGFEAVGMLNAGVLVREVEAGASNTDVNTTQDQGSFGAEDQQLSSSEEITALEQEEHQRSQENKERALEISEVAEQELQEMLEKVREERAAARQQQHIAELMQQQRELEDELKARARDKNVAKNGIFSLITVAEATRAFEFDGGGMAPGVTSAVETPGMNITRSSQQLSPPS